MQAGEKSGVRGSGSGVGHPQATTVNTKANGFTLIEIVITIVLIGILSGLAAMIILQGVRAYSDEQSRSDVHYQARLAMDRMAREIRLARAASATGTVVSGTITGNPTNSIIFTELSGGTISYSLSVTDLMRTTGGVPVLLANGITTLEFQHYDNAGVLTTTAANVWIVEINVIAQQGGETLNLRTRVHPRNF